MLKTIFFDLDGTLYELDKNLFVQTYYSIVQTAFSAYGQDAKKIAKAVLYAEFAFQNNDGTQTNEQFFQSYIEPASGLNFAAINEIMTKIYEKDFSQLSIAAKRFQAMPEIIHTLKQKGYHLMVLTNPVFPLSAVQERIRWAGLDPTDFEFLTSYETSHYCKPKPEYYLEVLNRFHLHANETMMIGNDMQDDIQPSLSVGLQTFYETDSYIDRTKENYCGLKGTSKDLLAFVKSLPDISQG